MLANACSKVVKFNVDLHHTHAWQISRYSHAFYHIPSGMAILVFMTAEHTLDCLVMPWDYIDFMTSPTSNKR